MNENRFNEATEELKKKKEEIVIKVEEKEGEILEQAIAIANNVADLILSSLEPIQVRLPVKRGFEYGIDNVTIVGEVKIDRREVLNLLQAAGFTIEPVPCTDEDFAIEQIFIQTK